MKPTSPLIKDLLSFNLRKYFIEASKCFFAVVLISLKFGKIKYPRYYGYKVFRYASAGFLHFLSVFNEISN